jgi:hypothetical protein
MSVKCLIDKIVMKCEKRNIVMIACESRLVSISNYEKIEIFGYSYKICCDKNADRVQSNLV